jgi:homoserine kinase
MPQSAALIAKLRDAGLAAVVSGAGPTVMILVSSEDQVAAVQAVINEFSASSSVSWRAEVPKLASNGVTVEVL